ncbi:MAG: GNAT superfamily N-acetyltransferase [Enterobacterales bacterium]
MLSDQVAITALIKKSVRVLALTDYSSEQIEGALKSAWGLDTQLINDQSYFVVEDNKKIIASGGWSFRKTLFGNNNESGRDALKLDPLHDYAKIRAFFVDPDYSRQGIGSLIMTHCQQAAVEKGFTKLELMSTLPGKPLYEYHGFKGEKIVEYKINEHLSIDFVPMLKLL